MSVFSPVYYLSDHRQASVLPAMESGSFDVQVGRVASVESPQTIQMASQPSPAIARPEDDWTDFTTTYRRYRR